MASTLYRHVSAEGRDSIDEYPELPDDRIQGIQARLPVLMQRKDVAEIYKTSGGRSTFLLGPAVNIVRFTSVMLTISLLLYCFIARKTAVCWGQGARYPFWTWIALAPALGVHCFTEFKVLQCYVPAYIDMQLLANSGENDVFTVMGCRTNFTVWVLYIRLLSTSNFLDDATDAAFAGSILKTMSCPSNSLEERWAIIWEKSSFGQLGLPLVSVQHMVLCCWLLTFLQILFPLVMTIRTSAAEKVSYNLGEAGKGSNCCGVGLNNENIVREVGDASGLASIGEMSMKFVELKMKQAIEDNTFKVGHMRRVISLCQQVVVSRMLLRYLLENASQINIQLTFFALNLSMVGDGMTVDRVQALLSIGISILAAAYMVTEAKDFFRLVSHVSNYLRTSDDVGSSDTAFARQVTVFQRYLWVARFVFVLYALALVYCCCKMGALFFCKDYFWTIHGCVDLSMG